jgi:NADPH-dependent 2,4-dienoyl-CoA reductase/sulfur reductase-like enzyme
MSRAELLVIGAGPAGQSAAAAYREAGGSGRVVLLTFEGHLPYERPPLSKELLRGELEPDAIGIEERDFYARRAIELVPGTATRLDPGARRVAVDGEWIEYGTCVLATGAEPMVPPVDGTELDGVHVLRTVEHALSLREAAVPGRRAVVVGSGFIGCEAAASLRARGCEVALVSQEPAPQAERLGPEVAGRLDGWLREAGVEPRYEATITAVREGLRVELDTGETLDAGLVLLASGVRPRAGLAEAAGIELADGGEIPAGADQRTALDGVLACGDCCRAHHSVAGRPLHVEHWGDALTQGTVAGTVAAGREAAWDEVPGFWSTIGERTLKYAAWGDGFDEVRVRDHGDGAWTAWYGRDGTCVGVLTHERDEDYDAGRDRVAAGEPLP